MRTIAYGPGPEQVADLYLPDGSGPHPVAVLVHGGFWREQYRRDLMAPLADDLVARGYAVWNIEYRRVGASGGGWPATFEDAAAAVDHLADVDASLDLDRVAAVGHSAGGHLALWLASRHRIADGPGSSPVVRPVFAISQAGVADLAAAAADGLGGGAVQALLGGPPATLPEVYAVADPAALVPTGVPTLAVHGKDDAIVPPDQSQRYVAAATAAGDDAELALVAGDHFTVITVGTTAWDRIVAALGTHLGTPRSTA